MFEFGRLLRFSYVLIVALVALISLHSVVYGEAPPTKKEFQTASETNLLAENKLIPFKKDSEGEFVVATDLIIRIIFCGVLLAFLAVVGRKYGCFFNPRLGKGGLQEKMGVQLLQKKRISLSSKNSLHVVHWHNQELLIASTDEGVFLLGQRVLDDRIESNDLKAPSPNVGT